MFGFLRLWLAVMVVVGHLFWLPDIGRYAVFNFYILSGYLMTTVMHESYGYSSQGVGKFVGNRFLRLYPTYWAAALFSIVLIIYMGENDASRLAPAMKLPREPLQIFANVTMLFPDIFPGNFRVRLSPELLSGWHSRCCT